MNHFAAVCKSQIRSIEGEAIIENTDEKYEIIPSIEIASLNGSHRKYAEIVILGARTVKMMIDTGADVNILNAQLLNDMSDIEILPCDKKIFAFGPNNLKSELPVIGKIKIDIFCNATQKKLTTEFYLIKSVDNLIGCQTSIQLGLVNFA